MIDEKRLDLWDKATIIEMAGFPEKAKEMKEIIRLARLGLEAEKRGPMLDRTQEGNRLIMLGWWAEKHGIPALGHSHASLEQIVKEYPRLGLMACVDLMDKALAALPMEVKDAPGT